MSVRPLVSILTPSFQQGEYIVDTLRSVEAQDYPEIEHIVVDGGSTDGTVDALRAAGQRVSWTSAPDEGQGHALNKALDLANGDIVGWLNSDDFYVHRRAVATAVGVFERTGADVVYGDSIWVDERNQVVKVHPRPAFSASRLRRLDYISQPATFFRRDAVSRPLVDPTTHFSLDYELWLRLLAAGRRFVRVGSYLAAMRYHSEAKSVHSRDEQWAEDATIRDAAGAGQTVGTALADLGLLSLLKAKGLYDFRFAGIAPAELCVPLTFPPAPLRPLYQAGLIGSRGSALLLPRYLLQSVTGNRGGK